jgi:UTP--glucose-1-phosphate uridylyltransferase
MVEKPTPTEAPSNLAIIGRYILTHEIFEVLEDTQGDKNGEIHYFIFLQNYLSILMGKYLNYLGLLVGIQLNIWLQHLDY